MRRPPPHACAGVDNFIDTLASVEPTTSPGGTFRLLTADDSLGLALTGTSLLLFTLEPCTILQPHIHPHPELAFPLSGNVTFSVAYNNNSFTGAVGNTRVDVGPGGYALFPTGGCRRKQLAGDQRRDTLHTATQAEHAHPRAGHSRRSSRSLQARCTSRKTRAAKRPRSWRSSSRPSRRPCSSR